MTDPKLGHEPSLAALLDQLIARAKINVATTEKWKMLDAEIADIRATILARFGDRDVSTMIDKTYTEWQRGENKMCIELALMIKAALAQTDTEAAAKEGDGDGPR